jgi:hypothetical protein
MNQDDRLPIKSSIDISAELAVKASSYAATLRPPRSLDLFVEQLIIAALDGQPHKIAIQYKPRRETR